MEIITQLTNCKCKKTEILQSSIFYFFNSSQISLELAQDMWLAPASQAYVKRIFSLCGILTTTGRRNQMQQSLKMRAFSN